MRKRGLILSVILGCAVLGVLVSLLLAYASRYASYRVPLRSMEPTIPKDSRITVETIDDFAARSANHGDLVIFEGPREPREVYVQRLIGLPGDRIEVRSRQLLRNGEVLSEPYVQHERPSPFPSGHPNSCLDELPSVEVPPLHAFLMGDNRDSVLDSRFWGPIPFKNIKGVVVRISKPE